MLYNYQEAIELWGSDYKLKKAISDRNLYKIEKGIYSDKKKKFSSYELIMKKYSTAFLVKDSALYYIGFIDAEPLKIHIGTARNALRIRDERVQQHFYSDFNSSIVDSRYGLQINHILCSNNVITHITDNQNEIRLLDLKSLLFDLIRDNKSYPRQMLINLLLKFKDCSVFTDFEYDDFEENLFNENISLDRELYHLIEDIYLSARHRKWEKEWDFL